MGIPGFRGPGSLSIIAALACSAGAPAQNAIVIENALPGSPPSEWEVAGAGDESIQGFATDISVDQGETVEFKIDTDSIDSRLDIYRLGWYGGLGARLVDSVQRDRRPPGGSHGGGFDFLDAPPLPAKLRWALERRDDTVVPAVIPAAPDEMELLR